MQYLRRAKTYPKFKLRIEVTISIVSLLASFLVLFATIEGQRLDRFYREVSIRPYLLITNSDDEDGIRIRNDGTGPAIITSFSIFGLGKTRSIHRNYSLKETTESNFFSAYTLFKNNISDILYGVFGNVGEFDAYRYAKVYDWTIHSILHGTQRDLFKIDKKSMIVDLNGLEGQISSSKLHSSRSKANNITNEILARHGFAICYCSITMMYCDISYTGNVKETKIENHCPVEGKDYKSSYDHIFEIFTKWGDSDRHRQAEPTEQARPAAKGGP